MNNIVSIFLIIFLSVINSLSFGQLKEDIVQESTSYFSLDSAGIFKGDGAMFIKSKIAQSQFFLIGEQHDIHEIETFIYSLIPHFKKNGYNNYVTEIGPIAADKLTELKQKKASLKSYYQKYLSQTGLSPFGFFSTYEEERTLKQLNAYNVKLWGIDFENYASYLFLIDEIYERANKKKVPEQLYNTVYSLAVSTYKQGKNGFNPDLMDSLLQSPDVRKFLTLSENKRNTSIIEQFRHSLELNRQLTLGFWQYRADNMKNNFSELYHTIMDRENFPKTFIKFGAIHTARGTSFNGNLEVGNMIYELANFNKSKSFSLIIFPRYIFNEQTKEIDDLADDEEMELLKFSFSDRWTVINLKRLKELSIQNNIQLSNATLDYILKYDAIVIPPAAKYSTKIL